MTAAALTRAPHRPRPALAALGELSFTLARAHEICGPARRVLALLLAGLRGGGWQGTAADLASAEIAGGPVEAARVAAELLTRAFTVPDHDGV